MKPKLLVVFVFIVVFLTVPAFAQTSIFTYQGRLTDGTFAANGTYQMEFSLWDSVSNPSGQIGSTITNNTVSVVNGTFTVQLDFSPATPFSLGMDRYLQIAVRKATDPPGFTTLTPRQQITSSPYSIRTISATGADSLSAACVSCVSDAMVSNALTINGGTIDATIIGGMTPAAGSFGSLSATGVTVSGLNTSELVGTNAGKNLVSLGSSASTGSGNLVRATSPTLVAPTLGAASATSLTVTNPISGSITGNAANVTGTVAIANGGTGATTAPTARTNLGLGTLATISSPGNTTTFLRGDGTFVAPPASPSSNMFFAQFSNPGGAGASTAFIGLSGSTNFTSNAVASIMTGPCTVDALRVAATITSTAASDNISLTLMKNGVATVPAITTGTFNVSTLNTTVLATDTAHSFTVVAGDTVSIQLVQSTGTPVIRFAITTHMLCQ